MHLPWEALLIQQIPADKDCLWHWFIHFCYLYHCVRCCVKQEQSAARAPGASEVKKKAEYRSMSCHSWEGWRSSTPSDVVRWVKKNCASYLNKILAPPLDFFLSYMRMDCSRCLCWAAAFQPVGCTLFCCSRRAAGPCAQLSAGRDCCPLLLLGCCLLQIARYLQLAGPDASQHHVSSPLAQMFLLLLNDVSRKQYLI